MAYLSSYRPIDFALIIIEYALKTPLNCLPVAWVIKLHVLIELVAQLCSLKRQSQDKYYIPHIIELNEWRRSPCFQVTQQSTISFGHAPLIQAPKDTIRV